MAWASVRPDGGRGFGFTGGHVHWNWGNPNFRKLVLNAIVWCARDSVPTGGVSDKTLTIVDLEKNQDYPQPANFNREKVGKEKDLPLGRAAAAAKKKQPVKPLFASPIVTPKTPGHAVDIDVDLRGAKRLFLVVRDGGNGYGCDWADWINPTLLGPAGERRLTELRWKSATAAWGQVRINKNAAGGPLRVAGKSVANGIGTHANSVIEFELPKGFVRLRARGGLDNGGTDQRACGAQSSVQFLVYTARPSAAGPERTPDSALANLDVGEGLEATVFAAEPMMQNPTNIDIDHRGRVWVCEVVNYRHFANKDKALREAGDRILILEDTDHDGVADKRSVFYQSRDIDSAHGVCVLPTPNGAGTRVIVSAGANVFVLTDDDGDDRADRRDTLFTGIGGVQHDHGIHAFVVGPDGKLYFNCGNEGKQIRDAAGQPIEDRAGNVVAANRQPYQQGMVFRCNPDGSEFETLAWNFRNNWEVTVDSFGTLWQSDNDDDGNRGVRINYVMEFGNYGYRDELTGAGWKTERTGMAADVPTRHWHQRDPGVVPNLLQTGAGSPTGICVYEGSLLPKVFRDQMIHTDAGPSIVRAYPVTSAGAGYRATSVSILHGARDNWFRPSDVCVAPDGSLVVADWYDPGVGGHRMGDVDRGRLFRVAPTGHTARVPVFDFSTADGAVDALQSPNRVVQFMARTALRGFGRAAEEQLAKVFKDHENPRFRARALWLLGKGARGDAWVQQALEDGDPNIRVVGIRLARQRKQNLLPVISALIGDDYPLVRRELAIALRHQKSPEAAALWAQLASRHDGKDRWYLEALGLAADGQESLFFTAWLKQVGDQWDTPGGRDIIWRSRAPEACGYLARILIDEETPIEDQPRYFRAFDFHRGPAKEKALKSILGE